MKQKTFNKVAKIKRENKFYTHKSEVYDLARGFRVNDPELTYQQSLLSAYIMSGKSILEAKIKIER